MRCARFFEGLSLFTEKGQSKIESFYEQVSGVCWRDANN